jgi:hypothetical protein
MAIILPHGRLEGGETNTYSLAAGTERSPDTWSSLEDIRKLRPLKLKGLVQITTQF